MGRRRNAGVRSDARGHTVRARALLRASCALLLLGACSEVLGFEDPPPPSQCVSDADCVRGQVCESYVCVDASAGRSGAPGTAGTLGLGGAAGNGAARGGAAGTQAGGDGGSGLEAGAGAGAGAGRGGEGASAGAAGARGGEGGEAGAESEPGGRAGLGGEGGEGGRIPPGGECVPGEGRCLTCDETGHFGAGLACEHACSEATGCVTPPSCTALSARCGPNLSCCHSIPVPGASFSRGCDADCAKICAPPAEGFRATVGAFALDAFEVTVTRFRNFVVAYPNSKPAPGEGKNPRNPDDRGWQDAWNEHLPAGQAELRAQLETSCDESRAWTAEVGANEDKPINCVNWFLAQAFCVWDGGRLPTSAEWELAASGAESRVYPWSQPPNATQIDASHAVYATELVSPEPVGQLAAGRGRFGHYDLAGNVAEWVFDAWGCYAAKACIDCGDPNSDFDLKTVRGGSFLSEADHVRVAVWGGGIDTDGTALYGFRCARNL